MLLGMIRVMVGAMVGIIVSGWYAYGFMLLSVVVVTLPVKSEI